MAADSLPVTIPQFRQNFPAFASMATYPNSMVQFWLDVATKMVNANRWLNMTYLGIQLFTAHQCSLEAKALQDAENGQVGAGQNTGPVNSKSVDKVSVGYDTAGGSELGAGHWNLTTYGTRFIRMTNLFGAGPVTINGGGCPDPLSSNGAWTGPDCNPGFANFGN